MEIFRKYQEDAKRTCVDLGDLKLNLSHMVLGIISELEEYNKAMVEGDMVNAREELADMCWYLANYCNFRGFDLDDIIGNPNSLSFDLEDWEEEVSLFFTFSSRLSDYVKKHIAYNKPLDDELEKKAIEAIAYSLTLDDNYFDFEVDLKKNIDKLKQRYPEKFTEENALNRDLKAERLILEG